MTKHTLTPEDLEFRAQVREVRAHTARIREALKELPTVIRQEGYIIDGSSDKQNLREVLQEIVGSAVGIADILEVEL